MTTEAISIFLDESGTAGVPEQPFVTAGVAIRGDVEAVSVAWSVLCKSESLPSKGTKYSKDNFLALAQFLVANKILPVVSQHILDEAAEVKLRAHCKDLENHRKPTGLQKLTYAHYIWVRHLIGTIGHSLIPITRHMGPFDTLKVSVDQYQMTPEMMDFVKSNFYRLFHRKGGLMRHFQSLAEQMNENTVARSVVDEVIDGFGVSCENLEIDLNSKGPLGRLSDAVAAMVRQRALQKNGAGQAWQVLTIAYEGKTELIVDTTSSIVDNVIPWSDLER